VIGYTAVVLATIGHFYPIPYPDSHYHLVRFILFVFVVF
jgi:hypothetical protein